MEDKMRGSSEMVWLCTKKTYRYNDKKNDYLEATGISKET